MHGSIVRLWLVHFIRGMFITLLPFATLTLFDTALPARSVGSTAVLLSIAIGLGFSYWLLKFLADGAGGAMVEGVNTETMNTQAKKLLLVYTSDNLYATSEVPWIVAILCGMYIFVPTLGILLIASCVVVFLFSTLYSAAASSLLIQIIPTIALFGAAFLSLGTSEVSPGSILFVMITSSRLTNSCFKLAQSIPYIKTAATPSVTSSFQRALPAPALSGFKSKSRWAIFAAVVLVAANCLFLLAPIKRSLTFSGEAVKAEKVAEVKATSSSIVQSVSTEIGSKVASGQMLMTTLSQAAQNLELLSVRLPALKTTRDDLVKLHDEGKKLRAANIEQVRKQVARGTVSQNKLTELRLQDNRSQTDSLRVIADLDSEMHQLRINLSSYRVDSQRTEYVSPVSGTLDFMASLKKGTTIASGDVLFRVIPDGFVVIEAYVPSSDRPYLDLSSKVILKEQRLGNKFAADVDGRITLLSSLRDSDKEDSFRVVISADTPLKAGNLYTVNVATDYVRIWQWLLDSTVFQYGLQVR